MADVGGGGESGFKLFKLLVLLQMNYVLYVGSMCLSINN